MPLFGTRGAASVTGFGGLAKLGYLLRNSLRFRRSNSATLSRTPSVSGNRKVWTWSAWVKRGSLGGTHHLFGSPSQSGNDGIAAIYFESDQLHTYYDTSGANPYGPVGPALYRDPAAWYHIVWAVDAANTIHYVYVNNTLVSTDASYYPPNYDYSMNRSGYTHYFGAEAWGPTNYFDGYMAEVNFVDGQTLTPSSFGKTDGATGQWVPKQYSGTYGTNGFYLKFTDASAATAAAIGKDSSGNGNNWTPSGISVTAGVTYDAMTDVPTLTSATAANYCVLNPLDAYTNVTLSNANLSATFSAYTGFVRGTFALPSTGQWYWEGTVPTSDVRAEFGIATFSQALGVDPQVAAGCWFYYSNGTNTYKYSAGTGTLWGSAWVSGDIIGIAFDASAGTISYYINGALQGGGVATSGLTGTYAPMVGFGNNTSTAISVNFGQRPFQYSAPSGYKALNTYNLP